MYTVALFMIAKTQMTQLLTHIYTYMYTHKMEYYTAEKDNENCHLEQYGWT